MTKRKPKRPPCQRERRHAFQLYLSETEFENLTRQAAAAGCSRADLLRKRINTAERRRKPAPAEPQPDARQVTLDQHLEAAS